MSPTKGRGRPKGRTSEGSSGKSTDPLDVHVGSRIRLRRQLLGLSQERLGDALGLTFQQVQKYERGANRVSASRLFDMAHILLTPISYFFDEMPADLTLPAGEAGQPDSSTKSVMGNRMTLDLIRDFYRLSSAQQQRCVLDLVRAMADASDKEQSITPMRRKPGPKPKLAVAG